MATSNTINTEALASPVYNPAIDETSLQIFKIMHNDYPEELITQYREIITSMPTSNPFGGVLTNPRACEISQANAGIEQIKGQLQNYYASAIAAGTPIPFNAPVPLGGYSNLDPISSSGTNTGNSVGVGIGNSSTNSGIYDVSGIPAGYPGYTPTPSQVADLNNWNQMMPGVSSGLDQTSNAMNDYQDHTDRMISNFPSILGMIQTALGIATVVGGLLNPCLGVSGFLGSILDAGKAVMQKINAAINEVMSYINAGLAAIGAVIAQIQALIAKVMAYVQALIAMVEEEIMKLIKSLIDAVRLGLAQFLNLLPKDPCFNAILSSVTSGPVLGALSVIK